MSMLRLPLTLLRETFALLRLEADDPVPPWATAGRVMSITRTPDELSIVCPATNVPSHIQAMRNWRCLKIEGPLELGVTGIMAALSGQLAAAGIPIFPIATYDTDYIFIREGDTTRAVEALTAAGHTVHGEDTW